jgi:hypothetical protein
LDAGKKVKTNLGSRVTPDASLEDRYDFIGEVLNGACAVGDWCGLETVKFVELVVYGRVATSRLDEV